MRHRPRQRPGYAMVMALLLVLLCLATWSVTYNQTASALRVETLQVQQAPRNEGALLAVAKGVALLETGNPPASGSAYGVTVNTSAGSRTYVVTFTAESSNGWAVSATPSALGQVLLPLPATFGP